jgi:hypothetical protein
LLDNLVDRKTIRKFYLYDYAGFDPENGKIHNYNTVVTQDALMLIKIKIFRFYLAFSYGITLE